MIFLTVGTQFPFDRLVKHIDDLVGQNGFDEEIYAQIGDSSYRPRNFEFVKTMDKNSYDQTVHHASGIISHAGMGSIKMAIDNKKPLLVMPRLKKYGEVVSDHQIAISKKFGELGHLLVAFDESDLEKKIKQLKTFTVRPRVNQTDKICKRITVFIKEITSS